MKNFICFLCAAAMLVASGCKKYDDTDLKNRVGNLENRVAKLEELCKQLNVNITSLQTIVTAVENSNNYITGVTPVMQDGKEIGYKITFSKGDSITIYHGTNGTNGTNGANGTDGSTPTIGVAKDSDGNYYWTLNGEWITDSTGAKIRAEGKDGASAATPQLKIENDYWYVSYDNGKSWSQLGKATGDDGESGESMFGGVDYTSSSDYVIFTLADGTQIKVPTWSAFEALQRLCNETNTNLDALQAIVTAVQNQDYITSVDPLTENGVIVGYTIKFAKSNPIVIYNGKDGASGTTPAISVKQDTDGKYYWTLDGEFIIVDGHKIQAQAADGADGSKGADGITPQLKIEEGYWYISYDNGDSWEKLDKAIGEDGKDGKDADSIKITQDDNNVYFQLPDGTTITLSKRGGGNGSGNGQYDSEDFIHFEDINVKRICVQNWDTNHDGELSYAEAAAVTSIGTVFRGNKDIQIFNEFQYFINVTELEANAFYSCSNLWHITLPDNISKIGESTFRNCGSLSYIKLPCSLTEIGDKAFESIYGSISNPYGGIIIIPKNVRRIGVEAFRYFGGSKIEFEEKSELTELGEGAFLGSKITEICIPAGITSIEYDTFYLCDKLEKVSFEEGSLLTSILTNKGSLYQQFGGCTKLTEFDASNCKYLSTIERYAFYDYNSSSNSPKITTFKIGAVTPPTCPTSSTFYISNNTILYVPEESIELYRNHSGWKVFKTILPLEE